MPADSPLPSPSLPVRSSSGSTAGRLVLGVETDGGTRTEPVVLCDDPLLRLHLHRPWFKAYLAARTGSPVRTPARRLRELAAVSDMELARHALLCGATGSGKSRLLEHLLVEQLAAGCSVVLLDPKGETADRLLARARAAGVPPERVTLLDPRHGAGVPGWNPLAAGVALPQAVADLVALLEQSAKSWGPRLQDTLTNALLIVGAHGLSLFELARFLIREDYREALLRAPVRPADPLAYAEARSYFLDEFGAWSRSERAGAVSPVLNKVRELLRSAFLRPLLCARRTTLDLAGLWQRPGLVVVRLDRPALGEEGTRLLSGLLTHLLFRTALRARGPVPVVLAIDELPVLERFVGGALAEIATVARSQRLRLLVACQHLAQLSDGLRAALLANAAVQAFFRLGHADARLVAASLAAGAPAQLGRVNVTVDRVDRHSGRPELAQWRHPVHDACGRPLRLRPDTWRRLHWDSLFGGGSLAEIEQLAARAGIPRLYVRAAETGEPVALRQYLAGVPPTDYWFEGPSLQLVTTFPRPRLTGAQKESEHDLAQAWTRRLQDLPVQHAVLRLAGSEARTVRVVDVPNAAFDRARDAAYLRRCLAAHGQSAAEINQAIQAREAAVRRLAAGKPDRREEEDDGSIR